jgi:RHS repeat-associated protein
MIHQEAATNFHGQRVILTTDPNPGNFTPPAGMIERRERTGSGTTISIADTTVTEGATGDKTVTYSSNQPLAGILIALRAALGATSYYHHDQLGSIRAVTNSAGAVLATYTYDPYGKLTGSTGIHTNPFRWTGQYTDTETGLVYLRARYYDPSTGVFLTRDPIEPRTRSPYGYVNGDPLNSVDPAGLCKKHGGVLGAIRDTVCEIGEGDPGEAIRRAQQPIAILGLGAAGVSAIAADVQLLCIPLLAVTCVGVAKATSTVASLISTATSLEQAAYACLLGGWGSDVCHANAAVALASIANTASGFLVGPIGQAVLANLNFLVTAASLESRLTSLECLE